ncbi:hypothetical protein Sste5346_008152 [Sporothrix stenoceras]|uniref:Uncharacterized protein n=1 Tax=Sporothrix stenoceras TaxID=5173 RepID=A0ABR3YRV5_9PEZI
MPVSVASRENDSNGWTQNVDDQPNDVDEVFQAMEAFLAKHSVGGRLQFEPDGRNYNLSQIPQRLLGREENEPEEPKVAVRFDSIDHFKTIHKAASEFEDALETKDVDDFNKEGNSFKAWPILSVPETDDVTNWMILVESKQIIEARLPNVGETCMLRIVNPNSDEGVSAWWSAKRAHNNFAEAGEEKATWSKLIVFNVKLVKSEDESNAVIHALIPNDGHQHENLRNLELSYDNAVDVGLFFTKSDATFEAEMQALSRLVKASTTPRVTPFKVISRDEFQHPAAKVGGWMELAPEDVPKMDPVVIKKPINPHACQEQQVDAFRYLIDFHEPTAFVNIFDQFPHMVDPSHPGSGIPPAILKKYNRMNEHQRSAYTGLLSKMPHGIGMLPGGPGGGKTDWVMTVIGLMQAKSRAKVLYMLDINGPLDDATAKYIWLMKNSDLPKRAIRLKNFGTEFKRSVRVGTIGGKPHPQDEPEVDFSRNFMALHAQHASGSASEPTRTRHQHIIPTLDEAAWDHYDKNRGDFEDLTEAIECCNGSPLKNRELRCEIYVLYSTVLNLADFVATTPCVAGSAFKRMFNPDLVVFDEAAHARELSTLIAIANFNPRAGWIFIGDHRQTQPTVKSNNTNPHGRQLATSAMERAYLAGVLDHQLLINHRAFGRLEHLPSKLIYDGKMVSGIPSKDRFPRWAKFVKEYLEGLAGVTCYVPRLVVHLNGVGSPIKVGTSWYHPQHTQWTMERVWELLNNPRFRSAENEANKGTILLLAPYKAAVIKYQEAIEALAKTHPRHRVPQRVEARTWDSSQGHEADIVAIDYVRGYPTDFMDGMYRFNVGLTRARQGEWHLMHPNMPKSDAFKKTNYLRKLYSACETSLDGIGEGSVANITWGAFTSGFAPTTPAAADAKKDDTAAHKFAAADEGSTATAAQDNGLPAQDADEPTPGADAPAQDIDLHAHDNNEASQDDASQHTDSSVLVLQDISSDEEADEADDDKFPGAPNDETTNAVYNNVSATSSVASLPQQTPGVNDEGVPVCEFVLDYGTFMTAPFDGSYIKW